MCLLRCLNFRAKQIAERSAHLNEPGNFGQPTTYPALEKTSIHARVEKKQNVSLFEGFRMCHTMVTQGRLERREIKRRVFQKLRTSLRICIRPVEQESHANAVPAARSTCAD